MSNLKWLLLPDVSSFIQSNLDLDVKKLMLNPPSNLKGNIAAIADQILSRQKIKQKLPDWYANMDLVMPPPISTEQSSSTATAKYKANLLKGERLIDLTGGMGIDTLTLSANFHEVTYVEQNEVLCETFKHNASILSEKTITIFNDQAEDYLKTFKGWADFFIDPARRDENQKKVFHFENCTPNVLEMLPVFRQSANAVLIKAAPMIDITLGISQLQHVKEVHVVSLRNEVKEVLFLLDFQHMKPAKIIAVNLESEHPIFEFTIADEKNQDVSTGDTQQFLYDPNSSIMKAGAFKSIAYRYGLKKLSANTHLYTSQSLVENFPGRVFEVIHRDTTKKELKKILIDSKANVISKNYPIKADMLRQQLGLKDGGDWFIIGLRDNSNKTSLVICKRALNYE
jgi:16S rRNA G966 N2-methylase RsmD